MNYYTYQRVYTDAGIFSSVANHMLAGKTLYRDVWDHKPPMIYWINLLPLYFGDGSIVTIRWYERMYCLIASLSFFFTLLMLYQQPILAFLSVLFWNWYFYFPGVFQGGNLTEEYGCYALMTGIFFITAACRFESILANWFVFLSGVCFAAAVCTKEPFLLSIVPWCVYGSLTMWNKGYRAAIRPVCYFSVGFCLPVGLFIAYFLWNRCLIDWIDVLSYNIHYTEFSRQSLPWTERISRHVHRFFELQLVRSAIIETLIVLGMSSCFFIKFVKEYRYFPWLVLASLLMDWFAASWSGYLIEHYYLQTIPSYILVCASGMAFVSHLARRWTSTVLWVPICLAVLMAIFDFAFVQFHCVRMLAPSGEARIGPISSAILEHAEEGDTLWCGFGENSEFYFETRLLSPTKYLYIYEHIFLDSYKSSKREKRDTLVHELTAHPPRFMVLSNRQIDRLRELEMAALADWIIAHYEVKFPVREGELYLFNRKNPSVETLK